MFGGSVSIASGYPGASNSYTSCSFCSKSADSSTETGKKANTPNDSSLQPASSPTELTSEEQQQVSELKQRDREVRAHEAAHMAAGGGYVRGGVSFTYQAGPDGKRYAVGGEVSIDTSAEKDPNATIRKMQTVRSAALAPANPSGQDRAVAAAATAQEAQARQQMNAEKSTDGKKVEKPSPDSNTTRSYTPGGKQTPPVAPPQIDMSV